MNIEEIINVNKEGAARTQRYILGDETFRSAYLELMTIFLRQGMVFESAVIQVIGHDLVIILHGTNNQMTYIRHNNFFDNNTNIRPPISGDFAIVSTKSVTEVENILPTQIIAEVGHRLNNNSSTQVLTRRASISRVGRSTYYQNSLIDQSVFEAAIRIGISGFAIPVGANRTKSTNSVRCANPQTQQEGDTLRECLTENEAIDVPLALYASTEGRQRNWRGNSALTFALICNHNHGIVYDLENSFDFANLSILCSMDDGQLKRALSKSTKRRPFGLLEIHYDNEKRDASLKVRNLNEGEYEEAKVRPVDKSLDVVYVGDSSKGATSSHYGTLFDMALSTRNGNTSLLRVKQLLLGTTTNACPPGTRDLIGVTKDGNLVIGFESEDYTVLCTASALPRIVNLDESLLSDKREQEPAPTTTEAQPSVADTRETVDAVLELAKQISYSSNRFYILWKGYSDGWHKARGRSPPSDLGTVFMTYMNSGLMGQDDIDEYNRLLGEEE